VDQGELAGVGRHGTQRDRQTRTRVYERAAVRADELPAQHDALVGQELEDLAVEAADVPALSVNVPAAVLPADTLVDLDANGLPPDRRRPPRQELRVEPSAVDRSR
jgi:hypothetical protein